MKYRSSIYEWWVRWHRQEEEIRWPKDLVGTQRAEEVRYGWCLFLAPLAHPVFTLGHISPVCHGTYTWDWLWVRVLHQTLNCPRVQGWGWSLVSMLVPHHRKGTVMREAQHEKTTIRACMVGRGDGRESRSRGTSSTQEVLQFQA